MKFIITRHVSMIIKNKVGYLLLAISQTHSLLLIQVLRICVNDRLLTAGSRLRHSLNAKLYYNY